MPESPPLTPEPSYLAGLNPPQREAVLTTEGPVLVLAGAGTGKTAALTARLAHLIATRKAWPSEILAVTFTNKAAREMKERISAITGGAVEGMPWLGTFHATGAKMLRSHAELVGLQSNFTILDTDDQLRLMKQLISASNLDEKRWPARQLAGLIDQWKNRGLTPAQLGTADAEAFANGRGQELYAAYLAGVSESAVPSPEPAYIAGLNPPQREAVLTTEGPILVLAGAGTGKTAALTARLAHLIATRKAWPSQILAVTFTNKAAREMRDRVGRLSGGALEGMPWLGTFHSVAARMLRSHAELVGLHSNFTILDTDDQLRVMKQLISAANLDEKRWPARQLAGLIDRWKNRGWTPAAIDAAESEAFANGRGQELYAAYQERLKTLNACDFGDLLLHMLTIFRTNADVLEQYRSRFLYILVDE
ncbi:MAG: ATP-dependent helicase, partial [Sphingomicrobium sp.]